LKAPVGEVGLLLLLVLVLVIVVEDEDDVKSGAGVRAFKTVVIGERRGR